MYQMKYMLVYAENAKGALEAAHEVVHEKLEHGQKGGQFARYIDFAEDAPRRFAGDHMMPVPPVLQVGTDLFPTDDKRGRAIVNSEIEANRRELKKSMAHIRHYVANYTDDELFDEVEAKGLRIEIGEWSYPDDPGAFRYWCEIACGYHQGKEAGLYDFKGNAIWSPNHLHCLLIHHPLTYISWTRVMEKIQIGANTFGLGLFG